MPLPVITQHPSNYSSAHFSDYAVLPYIGGASDTTKYTWQVFKANGPGGTKEAIYDTWVDNNVTGTSEYNRFTNNIPEGTHWIQFTAEGPSGSVKSISASYRVVSRGVQTDQVKAPKVKLGIRYGNPKANSVTLVVSTLSDPVANPVYVSYAGRKKKITMVAVGTDAPIGHPYYGQQAGWVGNVICDGLPNFPTRTDFVVTQGSDTDGGSFICLPSEAQQNKFFFGTCDFPYGGLHNEVNTLPPQEPQASGAFPTIKAEALADENAWALFMIDDTSYPDVHWVDDSDGTGHTITDKNGSPDTTKLSYDYCLAYFNHQGMYDGVQGDGSISYVTALWQNWEQWKGRNPDRLWCFRNLNYIPQYGDHEITNDFGLQQGMTRVAEPTWWTAAITNVYDHFMKPLQPDSIANLSSANHWELSNGLFKIVASDGIYESSGDLAPDINGTITTMFGNNQIDDILDAMNTDEPFKIFANVFQMRWLDVTTYSNRQRGASWPLYDRCIAEFQRLYTRTGAAKKSFMDNPKTNGTDGILVSISGDYHHMNYRKLTKAAYTGNAEEEISEFHVGTIGASTNFLFPYTEGVTYRDCLLEYDVEKWGSENGYQPNMGSGVGIIDIYAERPPRMKVTLVSCMNDKTTERFTKEYVHRNTSNIGQDDGEAVFPKQLEMLSIETGEEV